jgi:hypothetical protein
MVLVGPPYLPLSPLASVGLRPLAIGDGPSGLLFDVLDRARIAVALMGVS